MCRRAALTITLAVAASLFVPAPASALSLSGLCGDAGDMGAPNPATVACKVVASPGKLLSAGQKLLSGHLGGAVKTIIGGASKAAPVLGLAAIVTWVLGGAGFALRETATLLGKTTSPELGAAWFSSTYLQMAAIAALLTLPFLFAAAVQALMRSDLSLLVRAAFGYLPLAMLAIAIAAPLTLLLLAASDSLSGIIERAAGGAGTAFLTKASLRLGALTVIGGSPFVAFLIGFFVAAGALMLWLELLLREVAVYVIVLMLPLVFAAFVWPARRVWAIRAVELLLALVLAKFAIVAVLALGAGALEHATTGASIISLLAGVALVTLAAFAPWALLKLLPLSELAAAAAGPLRGELIAAGTSGAKIAGPWADLGADWAGEVTAGMRKQAMAGDPTPATGAEAEAERLSDLDRAADSRDGERSTEVSGGVAGGGDPDPLRGTAEPPGGPVAGAAGDDDAAGAQPGPAEDGSEHLQTNRAEPGPSRSFKGFPGAEQMWQAPDGTWDPSRYWDPPEDDDAGAEQGDPCPPEQEPEDGRL